MLKQGEAGLLVKTLQKLHTVDELYDLLPESYWDDLESREEAEEENEEYSFTGLLSYVSGLFKQWGS
jgi:hypothetical protein